MKAATTVAKKSALGSWKTTLMGVFAGIMLILPEIADFFHWTGISGTNGVFEPSVFWTGFTLLFMGVASRDGDKDQLTP